MPCSGKIFTPKYLKILKFFWKVVLFYTLHSKKFAVFYSIFEKVFVLGF